MSNERAMIGSKAFSSSCPASDAIETVVSFPITVNAIKAAVVDEFGKVLEAASVKHGARAASTMRALMEVWGRADGTLRPVRVVAPGSPAANPAFDVTPARLVTSFVTERGLLEPHALHTLRDAKTPAQKPHI